MATYNFTIRASDSAGAFADQNFSLDVQRTRIDRFVATYTGGILRSTDAKTWVAESAPNMPQVHYGNGRWIGVSSIVSPNQICTSTDAVNWVTSDIVLPKVSGQTGNHLLNAVKYRNNKWMAFGTVQNANVFVEWSSTDLVNWTLVTSFTIPNGGAATILDFEFDVTTQTTSVFVSVTNGSGMYTRVGAGGTYALAVASPTVPSEATVQLRNGLWMVHSNSMSPILLSRDGVNWFSRNVGNQTNYNFVYGLTYSNGKLFAVVNNVTGGGYAQITVSSDGGITWVNRPDLLFGTNQRQAIAAYGGTLVVNAPSGYIYTSTNDGVTNAQATNPIAVALGTPRSISTRQL